MRHLGHFKLAFLRFALIIPAPTMDKDIQHTADFYRFVGWAHANRKRLIVIGSIVLVIAAVFGFMSWHKDYAEQQANADLMAVNLPKSAEEAANPAFAAAYVKVADEHPGTSAAARALMLAGAVYFNAGQFEKARHQFEQYLRDYPDYPLTGQALVGVASSYEGEGNIAQAAARYDDLLTHHTAEAVVEEARSALARLYLEQKKPEQALRLYEELERDNSTRPDSWTQEAKRQIAEVLTKYPELRKSPVMSTNTPNLSPVSSPTLK